MAELVIVVGGTRRVGRWVSEALLAGGHRVAAVYRSDDRAAQQAEQELAAAGYSFSTHRADALDPTRLRQVVDALAAEHGGVAALINCMGRGAHGRLADTSPEELAALVESNVLAVHNCVQAALRYLRQSHGRIVNFLSISTDTTRAFSQVPAYGAAKAMLASYSRSLARELAEDGITVNCIALGIADMPMENMPATDPGTLPTGRSVAQEDIAAALWYLLGPASGQLSGSVLNLSGGWGL